MQRGAQVGALAVDDNGDFLQINGEYVTVRRSRLAGAAPPPNPASAGD